VQAYVDGKHVLKNLRAASQGTLLESLFGL